MLAHSLRTSHAGTQVLRGIERGLAELEQHVAALRARIGEIRIQGMRLTPEHHFDAEEHEFQLCTRQLPDTLGQRSSVQSDDLRHIGDRVLGKSCHSRLKQHVAWSVGPAQRARQRHAHDGIDPTAVERVTLYDNDWSSESGG